MKFGKFHKGMDVKVSWLSLFLVCLNVLPLCGQNSSSLKTDDYPWVQSVRSSVVRVISYSRQGAELTKATGFVVSGDGKIVTALSALKPASILKVELDDGRIVVVDSIYASDAAVNLAVLKVSGKGYRPLVLGDPDLVEARDSIFALGYSAGLETELMKGGVKGVNEKDGEEFSLNFSFKEPYHGGPLLNGEGEVIGVLSKPGKKNESLCAKIVHVEALLEDPNTVAIKNWIKRGSLNPEYWRTVFGSHWQEKEGLIQVTAEGASFGGRSLCLWQKSKPQGSLELSTFIKLNDEAGAAGLVFHSDGEDRHYGFYPSNGRMRLTYFGGPSVYSWEIIEEVQTDAYKLGEWNHLKVVLHEEKIYGYVNNELVVESDHSKRVRGRVGLAKFRQTEASFKKFRVKKYKAETSLVLDQKKEISKLVEELPPFSEILSNDIDLITQQSELTRLVLAEKQKKLERELEQNRKLMQEIHVQGICREINQILSEDEANIDLWRLSLLIAKLDNEDLDVDYYENKLRLMARTLKKESHDLTPLELKEVLDHYLFKEQGYHGARFDYYNKKNSYVHKVIEEGKGIPLSMSILYMELGNRMGMDIEGVGLPGHFVVRMNLENEKPVYIDVFHGGKTLERPDLEDIVQDHTKNGLKEEYLFPMKKKHMIRRMLSNLLAISEREEDRDSMLRYLTAEVSIFPNLVNERVMMSVIYYEAGRQHAAEEQLRILLNSDIRLEDVQKIEDMLVYMMNNPKS